MDFLVSLPWSFLPEFVFLLNGSEIRMVSGFLLFHSIAEILNCGFLAFVSTMGRLYVLFFGSVPKLGSCTSKTLTGDALVHVSPVRV